MFFVIFCAIVASVACDEPGDKIPRGIDAVEGDFKYQAILCNINSYRSSPQCGGAILNEWYVLSSAYCAHRYIPDLDKLVVYLGTTNIRKKQQLRQIAEIKIPAEFDKRTHSHDIALVRTTEKIAFGPRPLVQPVNLPVTPDVYTDLLVSSGFGIRFHPTHIMETMHRADNLHYHETSIIPFEEYSKFYNESSYGIVHADQIGTQNVDGFDFCYGDEGNPLVANNVLYGIASWSSGIKSYPNIYTKVFSHKQWIEANAVTPY